MSFLKSLYDGWPKKHKIFKFVHSCSAENTLASVMYNVHQRFRKVYANFHYCSSYPLNYLTQCISLNHSVVRRINDLFGFVTWLMYMKGPVVCARTSSWQIAKMAYFRSMAISVAFGSNTMLGCVYCSCLHKLIKGHKKLISLLRS